MSSQLCSKAVRLLNIWLYDLQCRAEQFVLWVDFSDSPAFSSPHHVTKHVFFIGRLSATKASIASPTHCLGATLSSWTTQMTSTQTCFRFVSVHTCTHTYMYFDHVAVVLGLVHGNAVFLKQSLYYPFLKIAL